MSNARLARVNFKRKPFTRIYAFLFSSKFLGIEKFAKFTSQAFKGQKGPSERLFYVFLVAGQTFPVPTGSSLALHFF